MNQENPRYTAVKLLGRVEQSGAYSNLLLDEHFSKSNLDAQNKKFCTALFYGTLERKLTLDAVIAEYSNKPTNKLNAEVRNILRTALYQLLYMDSVPDAAAVDEAVKLAAKNRNPAVKGFVNGLLRSFIRADKKLPEPDGFAEKLSVEYSCPVELVSKWIAEMGEKNAASVLADSLGRPPITVRVNTTKITPDELAKKLEDEGFRVRKNTYVPEALEIVGGSVESSSAYADGLLHVQDVSCMLCCKALDVRPGMTVLDLCAAPGGKTFTLAEMMQNSGRLLAFDLHEKRARLIAEGARRLGLSVVEASANDAKVFREDIPLADRVLCDVPCSGLGVIRRKPEIKYKSLTDFEKLPDIQYQILETCSRYVKQDGLIVYSTCTLSEDENSRVVSRFLDTHSNFAAVPLWEDMGRFDGEEMLSVLPSYFDSDGFFIAKMKRIGP